MLSSPHDLLKSVQMKPKILLYSMVSLTCEILGPRVFQTLFYISSLTKIPPKPNASHDFLIILLSHDEISAFLLSVIVRNSSLLTGVLICLSRKPLLLRLHNLFGHVHLACVKIKRNGNTCFFAEQIYR